LKIGRYTFEKGVFLAPMEGVTDLPFRLVCKRMGAALVYSEFIASEALIRDSEKSKRKMLIDEEERPSAVQIFGSRPEAMAESAKIIEESGADILDLNFGCWVRKVVNHNAGAALLKYPDLMKDIVSEVVKSVSIPVTAKTRLGWDKSSINIIEIAQLLEQAGIKALTVHCRTRDMGMSGEADWSWIPKIRDAVTIPIILNGDVKTAADCLRAFEETGCDAVMIGRAALGNPFVFKQAHALLNDGRVIEDSDIGAKASVCLEHLRLNIQHKGIPRGINEFRKHYSGYFKGFRNASALRQQLVLMNSYEEIEDTNGKFIDYTIRNF